MNIKYMFTYSCIQTHAHTHTHKYTSTHTHSLTCRHSPFSIHRRTRGDDEEHCLQFGGEWRAIGSNLRGHPMQKTQGACSHTYAHPHPHPHMHHADVSTQLDTAISIMHMTHMRTHTLGIESIEKHPLNGRSWQRRHCRQSDPPRQVHAGTTVKVGPDPPVCLG